MDFEKVNEIIESFCEVNFSGYPDEQTQKFYQGKRHYSVSMKLKIKGLEKNFSSYHTIFYSTLFCNNYKINFYDFHVYESQTPIREFFGFTKDDLNGWAMIMIRDYALRVINCEDEHFN